MFQLLQTLTVILVAIAMALPLAHALELPGKLRLRKEQYLTVQPIYYPGFTFGGVGEIAALFAALLLTVLTPTGSAAFWLTLGAFAGLVAMHGVYWALTHPVNNFWLKDFRLKVLSARFFRADPLSRQAASGTPDWTALRNRWEYSHVIRAVLGLVSLGQLAGAVAM